MQATGRHHLFGMIQGSLRVHIQTKRNQVARVTEQRGPMIRILGKKALT
jgi:hypothetical protein